MVTLCLRTDSADFIMYMERTPYGYGGCQYDDSAIVALRRHVAMPTSDLKVYGMPLLVHVSLHPQNSFIPRMTGPT